MSASAPRPLSPGHCLVTGAAGFIGRHLCRHLQGQGMRVRVLLRRTVEGPWDDVVYCDLGSEAVPDRALEGVDTVFHLAGVVHAQGRAQVPPAIYHRVNSEATQELVRAAICKGVSRFVYFSSVKAVADPEFRCVDEKWAPWPEDPYGRSKREAEHRVLETAGPAGLHAVVLRPVLVYGPGVKGNLRRMLERVDSGRFPPLPEVSNRRSLVHVDDLVAASWLAAGDHRAGGATYIVSELRAYSTRELYERMCASLGRPVPRWSVPVPLLRGAARVGDWLTRWVGVDPTLDSSAVSRLLGSACYLSGRLQAELGWRPVHRFGEALPEMVAEYRREVLGAGSARGLSPPER